MRAVRMRVFLSGLNPGDVAGFDDEIAARMIARGEAVAVEPVRQMAVATAEQKVVVESAAEREAEKPVTPAADASPVAAPAAPPVPARDPFKRGRR